MLAHLKSKNCLKAFNISNDYIKLNTSTLFHFLHFRASLLLSLSLLLKYLVMENHHLHNFHFLRTLKSQPVKKTDGGEFRHPDIPCFQVIRAFDIKVYHFISAFEIASFWHNILGWNRRSGNELQFFLPIWFDNQRKTLIRESLKKSSSDTLGTVEPLITFCQSVKLGTTTWNQGDNL